MMATPRPIGDGTSVESRIRTVGRAAWWFVGITLAALVVGFVGWMVRVVFPPLVLGGIIVFLLNPIVTALDNRGVPRLAGTALAYLAFAGGLVLLGFALSPLVADQADELSKRVPEVREDIEDQVNDLAKESRDEDWLIEIPTVRQIEEEVGSGDDQQLSEQVTTVRKLLGRVFHLGLIVILGPILAFYLLVDLPDVRRACENLVPDGSKREVMFLAHRLNLVVGGFFRGQLAVALVVGIMVSIGLAAIGLPLWLIVGMIAGLFNIVPLIGPYIGAIPGIVIALTTRDVKTAIGVAIVMTVAQQIDNHFITPSVMRRAVQLHPAAVMMALLAFGTLGGFFGLLLAVPLTAVVKIVSGHLWRKFVMGVSVPGLDEPLPTHDADVPDVPEAPEAPARA
jgi:predicted PurR-regulated permease PerM